MRKNITIKLIITSVFTLVLAGCQADKEASKEKVLDLKNQDVQGAYIIGVNMGKTIGKNIDSFKEIQISISRETILQGFKDGLAGKVKLSDEEINKGIKSFEARIKKNLAAKTAKEQKENLEKANAYLKENGKKEGVVTTASGLQYKIIKKGEGPSPTSKDKVQVHYRGSLINGKQFDSSYDRNMPATFGVGGVIPGWTEALLLMKKGAKWQLTIPSDLAYGAKGRPGIPPYAVLIFDVELLAINPVVEKPAAASKKNQDQKPEKNPAK